MRNLYVEPDYWAYGYAEGESRTFRAVRQSGDIRDDRGSASPFRVTGAASQRGTRGGKSRR